MMNAFNGSWQDEALAIWKVKSEANILKVYSPGGRGDGNEFLGHEVEVGNPVIYVNFRDIRPETGVLSNDEKVIYWGDGSRWIRQ